MQIPVLWGKHRTQNEKRLIRKCYYFILLNVIIENARNSIFLKDFAVLFAIFEHCDLWPLLNKSCHWKITNLVSNFYFWSLNIIVQGNSLANLNYQINILSLSLIISCIKENIRIEFCMNNNFFFLDFNNRIFK